MYIDISRRAQKGKADEVNKLRQEVRLMYTCYERAVVRGDNELINNAKHDLEQLHMLFLQCTTEKKKTDTP